MRLSDTAFGGLLIAAGIAVIAYASTFPNSPGQDFGPGLFPSLAAGGLLLCGVVLLKDGLRQGRTAPAVEFDDWARRPRMVLNAFLVIADLIFYALLVDRIGFFITSFVFLVVLFLAFGVRRRWIPPLAAAVTLCLHFAFYNLLSVPLPWGWLEGIAW